MNYKNLITKLASMKKQAFLVWPADVSEEYKKDYMRSLEYVFDDLQDVSSPRELRETEAHFYNILKKLESEDSKGALHGYKKGIELLQAAKNKETNIKDMVFDAADEIAKLMNENNGR